MVPAQDGTGFYYGINLASINDLPLPPLFRLFSEGSPAPPQR